MEHVARNGDVTHVWKC